MKPARVLPFAPVAPLTPRTDAPDAEPAITTTRTDRGLSFTLAIDTADLARAIAKRLAARDDPKE